ncbi:MAG: ATP-binding cassette domain-containing protein [Candidatus Rokubacteria bacterium]|nr:ATP-binding cassette domain-containing protein [Candidatus Rokubacteria bacterium]MBI4593729.1 ATP-binding cassette domain-containing protein [Candidatus Rokubacteria bacterium]
MHELQDVRKVFADGSVALDGVSLAVGRGEQVAFIGPSGAGKTTLFRVLNLTLRPTSGTVRLDGADVAAFSGAALRRARRRIGTIYQQHNLVGRLRVVHNVLAGNLGRWPTTTALASLVRPRAAGEAARALAQVGIPEKLHARTDELSGGQQQRVAIARVLIQDPDVILADEPVSSVDPTLAVTIVTLLRDLSGESRKTLLMNLHSVELALSYFPRIVGIRDGRLHFDLSPDQVSAELLEELYAGHRDEEREVAELRRGSSPFGQACRPLPGFTR